MPRVILSSPDQKAVLRLDPTPDGPWWILQHAPVSDQRAWSASFGARTPVEIIAAVTDALTDPAPLLRHPAALPVHSRHLMHTTTNDLQPQTQLEYRIQAAHRAAALLGAAKDTTPAPRTAVTTAPQGRTR